MGTDLVLKSWFMTFEFSKSQKFSSFLKGPFFLRFDNCLIIKKGQDSTDFIIFRSKKVVKLMTLENFFTKAVLNPKQPSQNWLNLFKIPKKIYYIKELVLFSTISNRTIPGIVLSEFVLNGDPLYMILPFGLFGQPGQQWKFVQFF